LLFLFAAPAIGHGQTTPNPYQFTHVRVTNFFEQQGSKGPWLSRYWLNGLIRSYSGIVPEPSPYVYNYDKINNRLLATRDGQHIITLSNDSINSFVLADSNNLYLFEKIPLISDRQFFQPVVKTDNGYCLYKRLKTKRHSSGIQSPADGYALDRYDEYSDVYEYYIIFPDGKKYSKVSLKRRSIRKKLKTSVTELDDFFSRHDGPLTEEVLARLMQYFNDKRSCCHFTFQQNPDLSEPANLSVD
jgi:hypothetical protein